MSSETTVQAGPGGTETAVEPTRTGQFYRPVVDIIERADELLILADMPGVAEEVDIQFEDGELRIHGRVHERQDAETVYLLNEYGVGDFYRVFQVSENIDSTRITADYSGGVLTVRLPKVEAAKPRKINVQTK